MEKIPCRLITALAAVWCFCAAMAQEATVKEFAPSLTDLTAAKYSRLDKNGVKCALVKVQVIAENVQFQGGIIEPVERKPGEYWVYMPEKEQRLLVMSDSFVPKMVEFGDPLQASVTYILKLEAPQVTAVKSSRQQYSYLVLEVTPPTARVTIDGAEVQVIDGIARKALGNGVHSYQAEALGYAPESGNVTMTGKKQTLTVNLKNNMPRLSVTSTTPGTEIYINDDRKGVDSWTGRLIADSYIVEGRKDGFRTDSQIVVLSDGENRTITIPSLATIAGSLNVDYMPVGARIAIDGRFAGNTPDIINGISAGQHKVTLTADGYIGQTHHVTIKDSETTLLSGSLSTSSNPTEENTYNSIASDIKPADDEKWMLFEVFTDASDNKGYKYKNKIVIPAKYASANIFIEGMARVGNIHTGLEYKYGFITPDGKEAIPMIYDYADDFTDGLARIYQKHKIGYINQQGDVVIPLIYDSLTNFTGNLARASKDNKYGFIDKEGHTVIPFIYDDATLFSEGKAAVQSNGKCGYIDKYGNTVIPLFYDAASTFYDGVAKVKLNGKYGYIDSNENAVCDFVYDYAKDFSNGLGAVQKDGKWGYIDKNGEIVIPLKYEDTTRFFTGDTARVKLHGRWFEIDKTGKRVN